MRILIDRCRLLDADAPWGVSSAGSLVIEGNRIVAVGGPPPSGEFDRRIDGRDLLAMPGLINAHTHSPENFARATNGRVPFEPWLVHSIWALRDLTPRDYYLAAMMGALEMLRNGATAVLDHVGIGPGIGRAHLDAVMTAYAECGLRAGVAPLFRHLPNDVEHARGLGFDLSLPTSESDPPPLTPRETLDLLDGFFRAWHGAAGGRLACWAGPSGVQWFDADLLHQCFDLARQHGGGLHMHLMETRVQDRIVRDKYGKTAVAFLADERLLAPNVSLPHSVWLTSKDIFRLADAGAVPVHNPAANFRLGSGLSPIRAMLDAGLLPGLGADGSKSSDHQNMFGHLHLAALIHNLNDPEPETWLSSREVVAMATRGGAAALMKRGELGELRCGALADVTLLDTREPGMAPLNDAYHHLAYSELGRAVHTVIVDGRIVVDAGRIATFDANALIDEVRQRAEELTFRKPMPPEWQAAMARHRAYRSHVVQTTRFEREE